MKFVEENSTRRVRTEKTGNGTETVVPLSEQMGLNVFAQTEEARRKRQRD